MSIKQFTDAQDPSLTHLHIETKSGSGLPASTEARMLNDQIKHADHPLFGKITGRTRWAAVQEGEGGLPSKFLAEGWEESTKRVVLMTTEHLDVNAVTYQAGGIEVVGGERRYVRHVEVRKGTEVLQVKLVYDYVGPVEG